MPFLTCQLYIRSLEFFPPAESWLVDSNFPRSSGMQGKASCQQDPVPSYFYALTDLSRDRSISESLFALEKFENAGVRFSVDGKYFKNGAFRKRWRHYSHVISLTEFSSPVIVAFSNLSSVVFTGLKCYTVQNSYPLESKALLSPGKRFSHSQHVWSFSGDYFQIAT